MENIVLNRKCILTPVKGCSWASEMVLNPGMVKDPELMELYREIGGVLTEMGRPFGVSTGCDPEFLQFWRSIGATILFAGNDVGYVYEGAKAAQELLGSIQ